MTQVFIVVSGSYDSADNLGIYTTHALAEEAMRMWAGSENDDRIRSHDTFPDLDECWQDFLFDEVIDESGEVMFKHRAGYEIIVIEARELDAPCQDAYRRLNPISV